MKVEYRKVIDQSKEVAPGGRYVVDESQKVVTESRKVAAVCDKAKKNGNTALQEVGWTRKK